MFGGDLPDVYVRDRGALWQFDVQGRAARDWVDENLFIKEGIGNIRLFSVDRQAGQSYLQELTAAGFDVRLSY